MPNQQTPANAAAPAASAFERFGRQRPDAVLLAPMLVYLLLLAVRDYLPYDWRWVAALLRGAGGLAAVWALRRFLPPWGRPHVLTAALVAAAVAAGWYYGQFFFNAVGVPHRIPLPLFPGKPAWQSPREILAETGGIWVDAFGGNSVFWLDVATRILVAATTVAVVEELCWRAWLLRAFIDWGRFETLPLGTFTWFSFLGTSLLSTIQHPDNWAVSIPCWFAFNACMYWKRSVSFCVCVHGFTNLFLYLWVVYQGDVCGDARAWMHW